MNKKKAADKVYVVGTNDRLYAKERYDGMWVLIDRRGNYYASANKLDDIYEQVDELIKQEIVELR